jgi:hypothetical protein
MVRRPASSTAEDAVTAQKAPGRYMHGTDPHEQGRLSRLNDLLNAASLSTPGRGAEGVALPAAV